MLFPNPNLKHSTNAPPTPGVDWPINEPLPSYDDGWPPGPPKKRVYIAGPMRGLPDLNVTAFDAAASILTAEGYDVVNPHDLDRQEIDFDATNLNYIIDRDVKALLMCDCIYMLPGWQQSRGASAEHALAMWAGLPVLNPPDLNKNYPIATGCLDFFPDALATVAEVSRIATAQHHPDKPMHWDRTKSTGHADCLLRHLTKRGTLDTDGVRHSAKVAWRALALLQTELEAADANGRVSPDSKEDGSV